MKKYTDFFKNCRIYFRGETFKVIAYDMLDIHEIDLPNDDLVWKKSDKTLEQIDADDAGERICFTSRLIFQITATTVLYNTTYTVMRTMGYFASRATNLFIRTTQSG